jgi:hypothetical protein
MPTSTANAKRNAARYAVRRLLVADASGHFSTRNKNLHHYGHVPSYIVYDNESGADHPPRITDTVPLI